MLSCTACGEKLRTRDINNIRKHRHLKVLICKKCYDFYGDGNFSEDETGYKYCRWCADGGELIGCDNCSNAFCKKCISRNMGKEELRAINTQETWSCYNCDSSPLKPHRYFCKKVFKHVRRKLNMNEIEPSIESESNDNPMETKENFSSWVYPLVLEAEKSFNASHRRIKKLKKNLTEGAEETETQCVIKLKSLLTKHNSYIEYLLSDIKSKHEGNSCDGASTSNNFETMSEHTEPSAKKKYVRICQMGDSQSSSDSNDSCSTGPEVRNIPQCSSNFPDVIHTASNSSQEILEHHTQNEEVLQESIDSASCQSSRMDIEADENLSTSILKDSVETKHPSHVENNFMTEIGSRSSKDISTETKFNSEDEFDDTGPISESELGNDKSIQELLLDNSNQESDNVSHSKDATENYASARVNSSDYEVGECSRAKELHPTESIQNNFALTNSEEVNPDEENEKALRDLISDLSSSTPKRQITVLSDSSDSEDNSILSVPDVEETVIPDINNDLKLNSRAVVVVERMNPLLLRKWMRRQGRKRKMSMRNGHESNIDSEIASLSVIPMNQCTSGKSANQSDDSSEPGIKTSKKISPRKAVFQTLHSDSELDDLPTQALPTRNNLGNLTAANILARDLLLSSSDSSMSSVIEVAREKRLSRRRIVKIKSAAFCDTDTCSSSEEFSVNNKYKKLNKLLTASIENLSEDTSAVKKDLEKRKHSKGVRKKKKMKRIQVGSDLSDSSSTDSSDTRSFESDDECKVIDISNTQQDDLTEPPETPQSKGRKNIRRLMDDQELGGATKLASVAEAERRERVKARQKLYNEITEESGDFGEAVTRKLVLETDPNTKEDLVEVSPDLICKLKPHQVDGVKFMWECVIESLSRLEQEDDMGSGCVLAHCMGLGKTLQVITFVSTLLNHQRISAKIRTVLIACPLNTVRNWYNEFEIWIGNTKDQVQVFQLTDVKINEDRAELLKNWHKNGGVLIISYGLLRRIFNSRKTTVSCNEDFEKTLLDPGPDLIICDEGHLLKNETSVLSRTIGRIKTLRRVILTGTPLQNNLNEYHCMVQFVKPMLLGTKKEFKNRFVNPISNGQCADSNQLDVKLMKKRVHILHKILQGCIQRCDYSHVTKYLPPKLEFVISVRLSEIQISLYRMYLEKFAKKSKDDNGTEKPTNSSTIFSDHNNLRLIWTHPYLLHMKKKKADLQALFQGESTAPVTCSNNNPENVPSSSKRRDRDVSINDDESNDEDDCNFGFSKGKKNNDDSDIEELFSDLKTQNIGNNGIHAEFPRNDQWWNEHVPQGQLAQIELSGKILLVFEILKQCELIGDKILLFTQSLLALDLIEELLSKLNCFYDNRQQDMIGTWENGIDYFRMDGSTPVDQRKKYIELFNDPMNERARLFMISTKAGSLGTNLVGANRVIVLDASWNPTHDVQAIFRVYRFGQTKPVYVYRLLAQGSMEEKIYDRQVNKQSMAFRVVDEQQIERHYTAQDLEELYCFNPDNNTNRPTPAVPKDLLLAELLINEQTKDWIVTYHEHDSLLENVEAEELTEEERKAAWTEYVDEREGRTAKRAPVNRPNCMDFLTQMVDKYPTDQIIPLLRTIRAERPSSTPYEFEIYITELYNIFHSRYTELTSQVARFDGGRIPDSLAAEIVRYSQLIREIRPFKNKRLQLKLMNEGTASQPQQSQVQARRVQHRPIRRQSWMEPHIQLQMHRQPELPQHLNESHPGSMHKISPFNQILTSTAVGSAYVPIMNKQLEKSAIQDLHDLRTGALNNPVRNTNFVGSNQVPVENRSQTSVPTTSSNVGNLRTYSRSIQRGPATISNTNFDSSNQIPVQNTPMTSAPSTSTIVGCQQTSASMHRGVVTVRNLNFVSSNRNPVQNGAIISDPLTSNIVHSQRTSASMHQGVTSVRNKTFVPSSQIPVQNVTITSGPQITNIVGSQKSSGSMHQGAASVRNTNFISSSQIPVQNGTTSSGQSTNQQPLASIHQVSSTVRNTNLAPTNRISFQKGSILSGPTTSNPKVSGATTARNLNFFPSVDQNSTLIYGPSVSRNVSIQQILRSMPEDAMSMANTNFPASVQVPVHNESAMSGASTSNSVNGCPTSTSLQQGTASRTTDFVGSNQIPFRIQNVTYNSIGTSNTTQT